MAVELLSPAGSMEKLRVAIAYGADAVYAGVGGLSLRSGSEMTIEELAIGTAEAHQVGVHVYLTLNAIAHDSDLSAAEGLLKQLALLPCHSRPDAVVAADLGVVALLREVAPGLPIHLSTQANTVNSRAARFWESLGVSRIVLARELSIAEIAVIRGAVSCELEVFAHGAMCVSYSGRCLLSNYLTGRDANRGQCAQACRWRYHLLEEARPGQLFEIGEDAGGTYILNSKDLCLAPHLRELALAGVDAIKIEGRAKSLHYVASVTKAYRFLLDAMASDSTRPDGADIASALVELDRTSHRPFTTGFLRGEQATAEQTSHEGRYARDWGSVANVLGPTPRPETLSARARALSDELGYAHWGRVNVRNRLAVGEVVEMLTPGSPNALLTMQLMLDTREGREGEHLAVAHANYIVDMPFAEPARPMALLRREKLGGFEEP